MSCNETKIGLLGHFGAGNFGNESTLQAMLCQLGRLLPDAEIKCICSSPENVAADYQIDAIPMSDVLVRPWNVSNVLARLFRKLVVGVPSEVYRWLNGIATLWGTDALIIPGTGLLTDAFSLIGWGPYNTFKWSAIAKLCRCQVFFVSVGAGPLHSATGRFFVKSALSMADFRSFRDWSTLEYLRTIGMRRSNERICPDLAFSLPTRILPDADTTTGRRLVVGLGLMEFASMYSVDKPTSSDYTAYMETLVEFVRWLLRRGYNVRLLIGDLADMPATRQFKSLLTERSVTYEEGRVVAEPILSTKDLLSQLAATDVVVGTRFHNVLLGLLLNKPSIAISFHHKCSSLMSQMGLPEYCQGIKQLTVGRLIEQFCLLENNKESVKRTIREKVADFRQALDEQYATICKDMLPE